MHIRQATPQDLPKIITLLKLALGESLMPKSEEYWKWKHIDNPFGPSPVLVAEEGAELVGIRAFMRWEWQHEGRLLKAVRAVDTATHPEHQGRGIFKKLTMKLVEDCKAEGIDFIFNTPNSQSKPGYLKMGWQPAGKVPVRLKLKRPFKIAVNRFIRKPGIEFVELEKNEQFNLAHLLRKDLVVNEDNEGWVTSKSLKFMQWRYLDVPVVKYYGYRREESLVIFRLKQDNKGIELRIVETLGTEIGIKKALDHIYRNIEFDFLSAVGYKPLHLRAFAVKGPEVTVRPLDGKDMTSFINFTHWRPGLGDLELF